jgi:predicted fused transcriptional regulator/phosphomethylpyrimidine kinase
LSLHFGVSAAQPNVNRLVTVTGRILRAVNVAFAVSVTRFEWRMSRHPARVIAMSPPTSVG